MNVSYRIFYNYAKLEIIAKDCYKRTINNNYIVQFIDAIEETYNSLKNYDTELIVTNNIIHKCNVNDVFKKYTYKELENIDFFIYSEYGRNKKYNKVIIYNILDFTRKLGSLDKCECEFLSFNIKIEKNNTLEKNNLYIELANHRENFYVSGNRINVLFISYLLKTQYNINIHPLILEYTIHIIDNNATILSLNEKQELIMFQTYYQIIPYDYVKNQGKKLHNYSVLLQSVLMCNDINCSNEEEQEENNSDESYEKLDEAQY